MNEAGITDTILEFVRGITHQSVQADTALVAEGLLDSFDAVEVIDFVEEKFELRIDPADIKPDDITSVRAMASLVARLIRATGAEVPKS